MIKLVTKIFLRNCFYIEIMDSSTTNEKENGFDTKYLKREK